MKKIIYTILFSGVALLANAQCSPSGSTQPGQFYPPYASFPCMIQGTALTSGAASTISFGIPATMTITGTGTVNIDSVAFHPVGNLPCGITATFSKSSMHFSKNEFGCILLSGTTHDNAGLYKLNFTMDAWINGGLVPFQNEPSDIAGLVYFVQVKTATGTCPAMDTSAAKKTTSTVCPTGINEVSATINSVSISPNPISSKSTVSFVSEKSGNQTIAVYNIVGKEVATYNVDVKVGMNEFTIEKGNLSSGVYFLSFGKNTVSKRFMIQE